MRIVFDTNVLFSAFTVHGACAGLYEECLQWARIVVSVEILAELEEKLAAKTKSSAAEIREVLDAIREDAEIVEAISLPERVCRDADDDMVLAAAISARADAIVTGDHDLLILQEVQGIPILNPRDCLARLSDTRDE